MRDDSFRGNVYRAYVGNIPENTTESELRRHFADAGRIGKVTVKSNFAFLDFDRRDDLSYAIRHLGSTNMFGKRISVEEARGVPRDSRRDDSYRPSNGFADRSYGTSSYPPKPGPSRKLNYRIIVLNLSPESTWSDLKDHMKQAGHVNYTACNDMITNMGVVEYERSKDIKKAVEMFNGTKFMGRTITVIDPKTYADSEKDGSASPNKFDNTSYKSVDMYSKSRSRSRSFSSRRSNSRNDESSSRPRSKSRSRSPSQCSDRKASHSPAKRAHHEEKACEGTPSKQAKVSNPSLTPEA